MAQDRTLRTPEVTGAMSDISPSTTTCCVLPAKNASNPHQSVSSDAIKVELVQETFVWDYIKCLREVHDRHIHLFAITHALRQLVHEQQQLRFTGAFSPEAMLVITSRLLSSRWSMMLRARICSQSLQHTAVRETGLWLAALCLSPFLKMGVTRAFFHCVGTVQLSMEFWKNFASGSLNGSASSLSTLVDIWSGPDALWGFSSFSSFCLLRQWLLYSA